MCVCKYDCSYACARVSLRVCVFGRERQSAGIRQQERQREGRGKGGKKRRGRDCVCVCVCVCVRERE